ncbi:uncharacterized protein LOC117314982 [Pecten maximus]|uniref:uncharacterized protein LOC117314982 n=1 Tax=Pecten maximus TaxID=6579 RepID=UPI0014585AA2|nr:uncharacterized protein LOC117314982 [Pecten maximus]
MATDDSNASAAKMCVSNEKMCVSNEKMCVSNEKMCVSNEKMCVSNEKMCVSNEKVKEEYQVSSLDKAEESSPPQKQHKPLKLDLSKTCTKATFEDENYQQRIAALLDRLRDDKECKTLPEMHVLDTTQISLDKGRRYEKDKDYGILDNLGTDSILNEVHSVKDILTGKQHVRKVVMHSADYKNEINAMIDLQTAKAIISPELYGVCFRGKSVDIHMELIRGVTLRTVADEKLNTIDSMDLLRKFALIILYEVLSAVHTMHEQNWVHRDLHAGNLLLVSRCRIEAFIIDYGSSIKLTTHSGQKDFSNDMKGIARIFTLMYVGQEFGSIFDLCDGKWETILEKETPLFKKLGNSEQDELLDIMKRILKSKSQADTQQILEDLQEKLKHIDIGKMDQEIKRRLFTPELVQSSASTTQTPSNRATPVAPLSRSTETWGDETKMTGQKESQAVEAQSPQVNGTLQSPLTVISPRASGTKVERAEKVLRTGYRPLKPKH